MATIKVLDIGFGTGVLTKKLYDDGYEIYGIDFSRKMLEIAKDKMPSAKLHQYDFSKGLPKELENIQFDYIISTYAMHHLEDKDKIKFINKLKKQLFNDGEIIIGDIAFETRALLEQCKIKTGEWDDEEIYIVFDELKKIFPKEDISFTTISHCAGIIQLKNYPNLYL
ncbi:class I SAM-dependent methyltransferase [Sporanaerobacter acetigenes]|uniref:Putative AdoMet-dependent methyltransferase n=1 Tax=Sporanaerobacter acetigenes DSM 13106 TaxID=1123281 RepID=A0A1M5YWA5_9FIRM|nr:class I SAM-dependent methyltransferase [Sporanaerobacter acetigenes]SHI16144.1 putative AdoMet-dependent methyltransferase [Sporanaerobacter acetigenes DSM 13106]